MTLYALVKDNTVIKTHDFVEAPPNLTVNKGKWVPYIIVEPPYNQTVQSRVAVTTITASEVTYTYVNADRPIADIADAKKLELAAKSNEVEEQGVTVAGMLISSDQRARTDLTAALKVMDLNPLESVRFKSLGGAWATADKTTLGAMQNAMWTHIKATRANEEAHHSAIEALVVANKPVAISNYDFSTGWL